MKRSRELALYDAEEIHRILDATFICHVALRRGATVASIPTMFARVGGAVYIHGSTVSRLLEEGASQHEVSLSVARVDGIVLARSIFEHSLNYSSVVVFGRLEEVSISSEKLEALRAFSEKLLPGRWDEVRAPNVRELRATSLFRIAITEASAKERTGPPTDGDSPDGVLPVWAGVIPFLTSFGKPVPDPSLSPEVQLPSSISRLSSETSFTSPPQ